MSKAAEYFNSLRSKEVAVVGIGVSHRPLLYLLAEQGISVTAYDKKTEEQLGEEVLALRRAGVRLELGASYLDRLKGDVIFKTPGMRSDHPAFIRIRQAGGQVTSEMEVFFQLCPCRILAVTGSDGKTTTTSLITAFLREQGYSCHLGGNIGKPLLPEIFQMKPEDFAVLELSSFQLNDMKQSPSVAVVTNLAPNHLDWHTDMTEYINAKKNIFRYQSDSDVLILNQDNAITSSFATETPGKIRFFSFRQAVKNGVYLSSKEEIVCVRDGEEEPIMPRSLIQIPGDHNVENYMAAIAAVDGLVSKETICQVAKTFHGVEHRMEFVRDWEGVRYYNNSIATSPTRVISDLKSQKQKIIMLAGGYDKKIPFEPMVPYILEKVKCLILTGATAEKIRQAVIASPDYDPNTLRIKFCSNWEAAIHCSRQIAQPGDIVSLTPACAAFDCFANFEKRGEYFKDVVNHFQ